MPIMTTVGQIAPEISLYAHDKKLVNVSALKGEKHVLLLFFPQAFTGVCTNELNMVNNELEEYDENHVQVYGISTDSPFTLAEYAKVNALNFPLLSDHDVAVGEAFGIKYPTGGFALGMSRVSKRSAFLIDKEGIVRYAEILENAGHLPNFEAIKSCIKSL